MRRNFYAADGNPILCISAVQFECVRMNAAAEEFAGRSADVASIVRVELLQIFCSVVVAVFGGRWE